MRIYNLAKSTITAAAVFTLSVAPAFAAVNGTSVINSGDRVNVDTSTYTSNEVSVENSNKAVVNQSVNAVSNTGGNEASGNIGLCCGAGGSIHTGAATVSTNLGVAANDNKTMVQGGTSGVANLTDIVNTGDKVNVDANAVNVNRVEVTNKNYADVTQAAWEKANSGNNAANDNIGGGSIHTGPAGIGTDMQVHLNSNVTSVEGAHGVAAGWPLLNQPAVTNTGDRLYVDASAKNYNSISVDNRNYADVAQLIHAKSNTGNNEAESNVGGGEVVTSGAGISTGTKVDANSNLTGITDWMGVVGSGKNLSDVVNTGDHVNVDAEVKNKSNVDVNSNNAIYSYQEVWERSLSGYNSTNYNIGGGFVHSGGAGVGTGAQTLGNTNATLIGWAGGLFGLLSL